MAEPHEGTRVVRTQRMHVYALVALLLALGCQVSAQGDTPQKAVEILLGSRSELNRTNVWSSKTAPPQSVSVGRRDELLPGTVTYRPTQDIVHVAAVPEVIVRLK